MKLIRKPSNKDGWYEITPGDAQKILDQRAKNRPIGERKAMSVAEEIKAGRFAENGESVIFDDRGRLLDGQHRMRAIVLANKPIVSFCIHDIPERHFPTIDDGVKRTGGDALSIAGHQNAMVASSVARWLIKYETGKSLTQAPISVSNKMTVDIVRKNKDITDAVDFVLSVKSLRNIIAPSICAFCYLMAARQDATKAKEFFSKLGSGESLKTGNPILTLRNRMVGLVGEKHKMLAADVVAIVIKAWNAFDSGRELKLLRWSGRSGNESFPRFGENSE